MNVDHCAKFVKCISPCCPQAPESSGPLSDLSRQVLSCIDHNQ